MYLSACLKQHGHSCDVLIPSLESDWKKKLIELKPDLVGFSVLTGSFKWALGIAAEVREILDAKTIFGGVHVYLNPDSVIIQPEVDILCSGEGEVPLVELCNKIDKKIDYTDTPGFWFKKGEEVIKTPMAKQVDDLDSLPFADRTIYWKYSSIEKRATFPMLGSRGCPYTCAYCFIPSARKLFKNSGKFIRERSAANILKEIEWCLTLSNKKKQIQFVDDHFGNNRDLYFEVLSSLSKFRNGTLKWAGAIRIERFNKEEYARKLSTTNHGLLGIAVECGNEEYRKNVLKRDVKNEEIIDTANLARKYGMKFTTLNMVALPGETYEMALETLDINIKIKPVYANCYIYQPFPNTELQQYSIEHNLISEKVIDKIGISSYDRYDLNDEQYNKLVNLQRVFGLIVLAPWLKKPLLKLVEKDARLLLDVFFGIYHITWLLRFIQLSVPQLAFIMYTWVKSRFAWGKSPMKVSFEKGEGQLYADNS